MSDGKGKPLWYRLLDWYDVHAIEIHESVKIKPKISFMFVNIH